MECDTIFAVRWQGHEIPRVGEERHAHLSLVPGFVQQLSCADRRVGDRAGGQWGRLLARRGAGRRYLWQPQHKWHRFHLLLRFLNPWQRPSSWQGNSTDSSFFIPGQLTASSPPPLPTSQEFKGRGRRQSSFLKRVNGLPFYSVAGSGNFSAPCCHQRNCIPPPLKIGQPQNRFLGNLPLFFHILKHLS